MMIVVTGATGKLGHHVIEGLLKKVLATQIVAAVRNTRKAGDLAALGVLVRHADYTKPDTLRTAFTGADKLLLISSNELDQRIAQHRAVVAAAKTAGVHLIAYTSALRADSSTLGLAADHKATEAEIRSSGLDFVFLRNGWYLENHTDQLGPAVQHGAILGAAGNGRFASASRSDYAAAAVVALADAGHENRIYELAGDHPFTLAELAAEVSRQAGKLVSYHDLPPKEYESALVGLGIPPSIAEMLADSDLAASRGELDSSSDDLRRLIGRPTTTLFKAVARGLSRL
jgi:NAD(P)H dehydrogenase (quinone)